MGEVWGGGRSTPKRTDCQLHSDSELDMIFKPALSSEWTHQGDGMQCSESLLCIVSRKSRGPGRFDTKTVSHLQSALDSGSVVED
jgi:hypothetical protein